jgi:hypothetical protein
MMASIPLQVAHMRSHQGMRFVNLSAVAPRDMNSSFVIFALKFYSFAREEFALPI